MKLLIHDLTDPAAGGVLAARYGAAQEIGPGPDVRPCAGCFGCWVKTPGACVIHDRIGDMGELLARCDEVVIVSRLQYGSFSPFVRRVLDRSIPYLLPWFTLRQGEMHHQTRYRNRLTFTVRFYGEGTDAARETARKLAQANALNFDADCSVHFGEVAV